MTAAAAQLYDWLGNAGGSLALSFIVALALGICALTVLFFGSAVVVLEHFARAPKRPLAVVGVTLAWAGLLGTLAMDAPTLEAYGIEWPGPARAWAIGASTALALLVAAQAVVALILRVLPARLLAFASVALLGGGYALFVGGLDQVGYVVAPALVAALAGLAFHLRRRRRGGPAGTDERLALVLAAVLGLGLALPVALDGPSRTAAQSGSLVLSLFTLATLLGLLPLAAAGFLGSRGSAEWFIAQRYLFAKRRQTFISVITGICVIGVAAGVWLIITVLSVMNGFERVWREEIIGNRAHLTVQSATGEIEGYRDVIAKVRQVPGVIGASPFVDAEGMVRGARGEIVGVRVRGIDPMLIGSVTDLEHDLEQGSEQALGDLEPREGPEGRGDPGIVIGSELARTVGVGVGDSLVVISPFGGPPTPLGPGPRLARFRVAGTFTSSFFQYDEVFTYVSLAAAQEFRRLPDVAHGIEVRTTDYYRSSRVGREIEAALGFPYYTRDWKDFFPSFFQALKTERVMMFVLLTMIMVVAAFAIVVTLVMMIMEKSSDIAILKTMGATDGSVERIFAIEGTLIGVLGTTLGVVAGIAVTTQLSWVQTQIENLTGIDTLPASVYQFSQLPWRIDVGQIAIIVAIAMVLALGATLLPSRHGSRLDPAEALRYE